ncbi:MAG: UvrD-helicase domain-containing protein [Clostridia bacterium]
MINEEKSKINFLPEQNEVLLINGLSQLVSASAGSGKTTVMIEKIARILKDKTNPVAIDEILVLTFTKAAAAEMKQRLFENLSENALENPDLQAKIDGLPSANISTIDSFCQRLITKWFYVLDIDPLFAVLDETTASYYKSKAFDNALEKLIKENIYDFNLLAETFGGKRSDSKLRTIIFQLDNFLVSLVNSEEWINEISTKYISCPELGYKIVNEHVCFEISKLKNEIEKFVLFSSEHGYEKATKFFNQIKSDFESVKLEKNIFENAQTMRCISFENIKYSNDSDEDFYEKCKNFNKYIKDTFAKIEDFLPSGSPEQEKKEMNELLAVTKILLNLLKNYSDEFAKIKRAKKCMDFNDLEHFALKLLSNSEVQESIKQSFKYVFIDEYQDTNAVQEKLLELVSNKNNRFMVGDVKQSIYAFRQSDPKIFIGKGEKLASGEGVFQTLNSNFRSQPAILNFVNKLFAFAMTKENSGIDYKSSSMFNPLASFDNSFKKFSAVEVLISENKIETKEEKKQKDHVYSIAEYIPEKNAKENVIQKEAKIVASKIFEIKNQRIYDNKIKAWREVNFGDFVILLRTKKSCFDFQEALLDLNVPVTMVTQPKLFENKYALQMISLCKVVSCFLQDEPLINVLLSRFGGFDENELAQIRLENSSEHFFHKCFLSCAKNSESSIFEKANQFVRFIETLKKKCGREGIAEMLNYALNETNFVTHIMVETKGDTSQSMIANKFAEYFRNTPFEFDLDSFLDYADKNEKELAGWTLFESNNSQVKITTIHASKGLEFPIVILPFCGKPLCDHKENGDVLLSKNLGIAIKHCDTEEKISKKLSPWKIISIEKEKEELAEELRIWYVALTRAKNHLLICGTIDSLKKIEIGSTIQKKDSILELIMKSLDKNELKQFKQERKLSFLENGNDCVFEIFDDLDFAINNQSVEEELFIDSKEREKIEKQIENVIKFSFEQSKFFLKNSVSSIINNGEEVFTIKEKSEESEEKEKPQKASLGTAFHYVFEKLDYSKPVTIETIEKIIENGEINNVFHRNESVLVSKEKVLACANVLAPLLKDKIVLKEKKFMMKVKAKEIFDTQDDSKILIQGKVDLLALGNENILFDFKLTKTTNHKIVREKYSKQLGLYKLALEKALYKKIDKCFIVLIETSELVEIF